MNTLTVGKLKELIAEKELADDRQLQIQIDHDANGVPLRVSLVYDQDRPAGLCSRPRRFLLWMFTRTEVKL